MFLSSCHTVNDFSIGLQRVVLREYSAVHAVEVKNFLEFIPLLVSVKMVKMKSP